MKTLQLKMKIFISILYLISGPVCCSDVFVYSGGSVILFPDLMWDVNNTKYICRMEQTGCRNVIKDQTNSKSVTSGRFKMYSNVDGEFTVLIRELNPQDSAVYRFGVGNEKYKDIKLTVQSDSCCEGIKRIKAYLGETATFKCSYPDEFKTNNKYLTNLNNQNTIIYTGKEAQKEQKDRFSIFDDRRSKFFSVNISDVTEDDGGVYLCGVWKKETSVGYYSYFREIQLQVTGQVFGYLAGSITLLPNLQWDVNNTRYMCKMEQSGCVNIIKDQTQSNAVTSGRFKMYSNTAGNFTVLIRELKPQDSAVYRFGVGNGKHKDIELTVQNDSCCGGIGKMKAYLGETATFKCSYPEELKTKNKRLINLDNRNNVSPIIYTGKEAQKEQNGRFSIFDDRSSNVFSVNISDVTEDDGGLYLCGVWVWKNEKSVRYYSYFREIQLQVNEKSTVLPETPSTTTEPTTASTYWTTSTAPVAETTGQVFAYSGGSVILFPTLQWDVNNTRYMCKMEQSGCVNIIKDQTQSKSVTSGRFKMYSNTAGNFTVLIRELKPQDSAVYRFGVGNGKHKDIELTVQNDSCCGGIGKMKAYLGETATFKCSYPEELKTNYKYLINLNNQTIVKEIIYTGKEAQKEQNGRFSIFDDRSSNVFSVNISDVTEDDGGLYLCGVWVWKNEKSVRYYSYFREIQLQVNEKSTVLPETPSTTTEPTTASTYWTTSTAPVAETTGKKHSAWVTTAWLLKHSKEKTTALPETPSTTMEPTTATTDWAIIAAPAAETSDDHLRQVFGYLAGSITLLPNLQWDVDNTRYMCKMEQSGCVNIIKDQTQSNAVTSGRFKMYSNTAGNFTVLIRELKPQDSAVYRFGVGNGKHKDIKLTVQNDSCCGGIKRIKAYLGETATFKCSYPDELKTNSKRLINLNNQTIVKVIIYTEKEAQKEQKDRFSIFDDRSSNVFSVNISDVREDDGGLYLCGVWKNEKSVRYYSYFREIQLQVNEKSTVLPETPSTTTEPTTASTYWTTSTAPVAETTGKKHSARVTTAWLLKHSKEKTTALPETPSTTMEPTTATTDWAIIAAPAAETSDDHLRQVFGYLAGSITLLPNLQWDVDNTRYMCKMEQSGCVNIIKDQTQSNAVTSGRFKMYSNTAGNFTVLIRELKPQDSAVYRFGVGNGKHKDIKLTVQNDSCCGGIKRIKAYLGETATFKCSYPEELKTNSKRLINLNNQTIVKVIIYTEKEAQKEQKDRFSIFDDRSSNVFSVNISDVREDDGGLYLCGVWKNEKSVLYYSYFREIQLQVNEKSTVLPETPSTTTEPTTASTYWTTSTAPVAETTGKKHSAWVTTAWLLKHSKEKTTALPETPSTTMEPTTATTDWAIIAAPAAETSDDHLQKSSALPESPSTTMTTATASWTASTAPAAETSDGHLSSSVIITVCICGTLIGLLLIGGLAVIYKLRYHMMLDLASIGQKAEKNYKGDGDPRGNQYISMGPVYRSLDSNTN
uniref:Ig-like domain-containing protein n=1 Tax=Pygocentrus nattereri TaxID=42514 RepID=A0AAR2LPP7_PYGNA